MVKKIIFHLLFYFIVFFIHADIKFKDMDISKDNILLFTLTVEYPGYGKYDTLFIKDLTKNDLRQATFFPEKIMFMHRTDEVKLQNRFGVFRINPDLNRIMVIDLFSSFVKNNIVQKGKLPQMQFSPDGKYLLYYTNIKNAFSDLALYNIIESKEVIVSKKVELDLSCAPGLWSGNSRFLVYSKNGNIYYYSIDHLDEERIVAESLRKIGKGTLKNVCWKEGNILYYLSDFCLYKMNTNEFFSRALYKEILQIGQIMGKIPFKFDPNFDIFWISPDGEKILLSKGGRNLFLYFLRADDYTSVGYTKSLPYLYLPNNTQITQLIWSKKDQVTLLTRQIEKGKRKSSVFRIIIPRKGSISGFEQTNDQDIKDIVLSTDEKILAVLKKDKVELRSYVTWSLQDTINYSQPFNVIWKNDKELVVSSATHTEIYNIPLKESTFISLSQAKEFGFSENEKSIHMKTENAIYSMDIEALSWKNISEYKVKDGSVVSDAYRIYLSDVSAGVFENMIMIRNIEKDNYGTFSLFDSSNVSHLEPFPKKEDPIDFNYFNHGSRLRQREVAIVFNVTDSIQGLTQILNVLSDYSLRCTFFINGEAVQRYPGAIREIALADHEVGSLFFAYFNMIDSKYKIEKKFIKDGLGLNEDYYFTATGRDFSLIWHTPYYFVNNQIIETSKKMGYVYIGKDVDTMDWVTVSDTNITGAIYMSSANLIEKIIKDKKPGSIIPIHVGLVKGKREDYLFNKLDVLINSLLKLGYSIVPVSTLIQHAK